jgi:flavodoxin
MRRIVMAVAALVLTLGINAQTKSEIIPGKKLVAYFSVSGNTKKVAEKIAQTIGADLFEIQPSEPYTAADVDYRNRESRCIKEMGNPTIRPAIANKVTDMKKYETVLIGYPLWGNLPPNVINTFMESYDFSGKTVMPFATSGSSPIDNSANSLKTKYPTLKWGTGKLFKGEFDKTAVESWLN